MFGFMKQIKRKAFTLTELLIALGVIGVLTAILMPIVFSLRPDQNTLMAKRAFYTTETIISDLLNDNFCYPRMSSRVGLDDGMGRSKCKKWGGEENTDAINNENAPAKLVTLFADKLDLKVPISVTDTSFQTKDGMIWTFSNFNLEANNADSYALLTVDVNGDKDPNCGQTPASGVCIDSTRENGFDKFTMRIFARGRIQILDCWAVKAVKIDKKLVGKDDNVNCEIQDSGTISQECTEEPTSPSDFCCNDPKWKSSNACNNCIATPTSAEDYCCQKEGSPWIGTLACDPCTYITPTNYTDECCQEGHKWHDSNICNPCSNPYSIDCCLTKANSLNSDDPCCEFPEVKEIATGCSQ